MHIGVLRLRFLVGYNALAAGFMFSRISPMLLTTGGRLSHPPASRLEHNTVGLRLSVYVLQLVVWSDAVAKHPALVSLGNSYSVQCSFWIGHLL